MLAAGLVLAMLLAFHGLAAGSAGCCETNITVALTSTITIIKPETSVYNYGNHTYATIISKTSANHSAITVTSISVPAHSSFSSAISTAQNATDAMPEGITTTRTLRNATSANLVAPAVPTVSAIPYQPAANMSKSYTCFESPAPLLSTSGSSTDIPRSSKTFDPVQASSAAVNAHAHSSQLSATFTTTVTVQLKVARPTTITCTIGHSCSENGTSLSNYGISPSSYNTSLNSNSPSLTNTKSGGADFEVTSSTMTRTIIIQASAAFSATFTSSTPRPITPPSGLYGSATKVIVQVNTAVYASGISILNSTSVANVSTSSLSSNSTITYTSPLLSSSPSTAAPSASVNAPPSTPVVFTTAPSPQPPQSGLSTSTVIIIPITSTTTQSSTTTATSLVANSADRRQPAHLFALLAALLGRLPLASGQFITTTIRKTTIHPTDTVTSTPTGCAYHPDSQECMTNLGFNNAGGRLRPGPPFKAFLLAGVLNGKVVSADMTMRPPTTTVTVTIIRNQDQENGSAAVSSMESMSMSMNMNMNSTRISVDSDSETAMPSSSSCAPFCNASGGIVAPSNSDSASTPLRSRPGSAPTPSISHRPAGEGSDHGSGKGVGALLLALGLVFGFL